jgi:alkylated DNA repair dioxygenase AlkB
VARATELPEARLDLGEGAWVELVRGWCADEGAVFASLLLELAWEARTIVLFGKPVMQPRLVAWAGERPYRYSGRTLPPSPLGPALSTLRSRVEAHVGQRFDHVLVNRYRDGSDSMGWHADAEPELGPNPTIASISLGAPRRFVLRHAREKGRAYEAQLGRGDLLVMGGACQHLFRHAVPKDASARGERINVTLRKVLHDPPSERVSYA